jgi:hypothetical protein
MTDAHNPNSDIHRLKLSGGQGEVFLYAGSIQSARKESPFELAITIGGPATFYVEAADGLLTEILRSMAACLEYNEAKAELAAGAIR